MSPQSIPRPGIHVTIQHRPAPGFYVTKDHCAVPGLVVTKGNCPGPGLHQTIIHGSMSLQILTQGQACATLEHRSGPGLCHCRASSRACHPSAASPRASPQFHYRARPPDVTSINQSVSVWCQRSISTRAAHRRQSVGGAVSRGAPLVLLSGRLSPRVPSSSQEPSRPGWES